MWCRKRSAVWRSKIRHRNVPWVGCIEWFVTWHDFGMHVFGAVLMGIGGVLAMGCTIGQGITGLSTLALGSIVTIIAIIAGSAATMKYQYYRMMREDD